MSVPTAKDEVAMFEAVKRTDIYGDDDAAALRDLLFSWWEERAQEAADSLDQANALRLGSNGRAARRRILRGTGVHRPQISSKVNLASEG